MKEVGSGGTISWNRALRKIEYVRTGESMALVPTVKLISQPSVRSIIEIDLAY